MVNPLLYVHIQVFSGASISFGKMDCVQSNSDVPLPSSVLLKAMRIRNNLTEGVCDKDHAELSENIRLEFSLMLLLCMLFHISLLLFCQITCLLCIFLFTLFCREFMAAKRNTVDGRNYVTTQEIVDEFPTAAGLTLPAFRAILQQISVFDKVDGVGRWTLRTEFA